MDPVKQEVAATASSRAPGDASVTQAKRTVDTKPLVHYARKRLQKNRWQNWWSWMSEQKRRLKQQKPQQKPAGETQCSVCDKPTATRSEEVHHAMDHAFELSYRCEECHRKFARKFELEWHLRQHTGVRPLPCGLCPAEFLNGRLLTAHHTRHHGLRSKWHRFKTN
ncbi:zinc finger protein 557-like [Dermacentor albipictus]|uniref:zinc finger protein 557-like n=1 Tax=Dermacentor albipictus TaxID=60249 RepID=UPI0038FCA1A7